MTCCVLERNHLYCWCFSNVELKRKPQSWMKNSARPPFGQCGDEIGIYIYSNFAWLAISLYGASRTTTTRSLSPWPWSTRRTTTDPATAWWTSPPSCRDEVLATINWRDELCYKIHSYIDKEPSSSIFQILSVRKGISDTWPNLHCHFFQYIKYQCPPLTQ